MATIKYFGQFPCPRCLIPKAKISYLGMKRDMKQRHTKLRRDNQERRDKIMKVRKLIFQDGVSVKSQIIEGNLGSTSSVPTMVGLFFSIILII